MKYEFEAGFIFAATITTFFDWLTPVRHLYEVPLIAAVMTAIFLLCNRIWKDKP